MNEGRPILMTWDANAQAMRPANSYWAAKARAQFADGKLHEIVEQFERSGPSHRAYFASVREAWKNLPGDLAERYPTPEHLRKRALIKAGYYDCAQIVFPTAKAAQDAAAFMQPMDEYAVIVVKDCVVTRYTAKSQSYRAMGKKEFQESREKVLALLADMLGTTPQDLAHAEAA